MKRVIKASNTETFTFRFYFKDGNQRLVEAEDIYSALSYILFEKNEEASNIYKIEEVK